VPLRLAVTKLKIIFVLDLIIVALAAWGYYVQSLPPAKPMWMISELIVSPYEVWVNETITISVKVSNNGDEAGKYALDFRVDDLVRETKVVELSPGETTTANVTVTATSEGLHSVKVYTLTGAFTIVPTGMRTLSIASYPSGVKFTLNGKSHSTPYSELMNVGGTYVITMPTRTATLWQFHDWEDGSTSMTRIINLQSYTSVTATYRRSDIMSPTSCPALHIWNGSDYIYITEVSDGTGYLGILDYFREDGSIVFAYSYPWDHIKLDRSQPQPRNGHYDVILTQKSDEIFYVDAVKLVVVDHSPDVDVYSTKNTYIYNLEGQGKIYTISKNPLTPISAINGEGEDCLPQISQLDGIYTTGHEFQYDTLELNLGDLSYAKEIKLIVAGTIIYSSGQAQGEWAAQFVDQPGVKPFPPPYMEVKDENGSWVRVPESRQFPLVDVGTDSFVVNLTGLFPTNDYSLRINTFFNTCVDYIGVDTTPQQNVTIQEIKPVYADFTQVFATDSTSTGNFTRYGDVTLLVLEADDKFVIGRQGDEIHLQFLTDIRPVPENMERDFFVFVSCWFKVKGLPYLGFTVDPLPFNNMSCFLYLPTESYPYDPDHLSYLLEYNTRTIDTPQETK